MPSKPFALSLPKRRDTSLIVSSPHSGRNYPAAFLARSVLDERTIRTSEDAFVDDLLGSVPTLGAPLLAARAPRAFVDLNRGADELDPALIEGVRMPAHNPRINSGLGVIPRVVAGGRAIYSGKITRAEAEGRISAYWHPYHTQLQVLIAESRALFGEAILLDCHSMPHEALDTLGQGGRRRPDVVLGDRFGASAGGWVIDRVEAAFVAEGLSVLRNAPFAGAYIAQHYGRPAQGQHVVQIEIDRALYMDETAIRPKAGFEAFRALMTRVMADIAVIGRGEMPLAAE